MDGYKKGLCGETAAPAELVRDHRQNRGHHGIYRDPIDVGLRPPTVLIDFNFPEIGTLDFTKSAFLLEEGLKAVREKERAHRKDRKIASCPEFEPGEVIMKGNIPTLYVHGKTLPEAWEKAVLACWNQGIAIKTEYDKPGDLPSRDCTILWVAEDPFAEPRIHRAFPGGLEDLEIYRQEVVDGVHDHWIAPRRASGLIPTISACSPMRSRARPSTRSIISSRSSPRPATPAGPRPSPGTRSSTRRPMTRPACSASGAGSLRTRTAGPSST